MRKIRRAARISLEYTSSFATETTRGILSRMNAIGRYLGAGFRRVQVDFLDGGEGRVFYFPGFQQREDGAHGEAGTHQAADNPGSFFFIGRLVQPFALNVFAS